MRKLTLFAAAMAISTLLALPASALEHTFGGYWRTRAFTQKDFSGDDGESKDLTQVDTRTRLYYTAKLNDNLKLVNKFEFDAVWGDNDLGDLGTDGKVFEIKNSYADFDWMDLNFKVGLQGLVLQRGFVMDGDFAGAVVTYRNGPWSLPLIWIKVDEGHVDFKGRKNANDFDYDSYVINPGYVINDNMTVKGLLGYSHQDETETDLYFVGVDFDATFESAKVWFTANYQTGDFKDQDVDAYLVAAGGTWFLDSFDIHGQAFYASGDDDPADGDVEGFMDVGAQSYYWSEIMGFGLFDSQASAGSPDEKVTNIMAFNMGVGYKPSERLKLMADLWYAEHAEDVNGEDELGVEVDLRATYQLVENLNLDVVAAYLFAGDATSLAGKNDEDPFEIGTRLSLSF